MDSITDTDNLMIFKLIFKIQHHTIAILYAVIESQFPVQCVQQWHAHLITLIGNLLINNAAASQYSV